MPGHKGIFGNEMADLLVKKGSETKFIGPELYFDCHTDQLLLKNDMQRPPLKDLEEAEF